MSCLDSIDKHGSMNKFERSCTHPRLLLVDDEPFNILILQGMLEHLNIFDTDRCFDGKSALSKLEENF